MKNLLRSQYAAGMSAHAIRNDSERDSTASWVRKKSNTILLLLAVALMLGYAGINFYRHYALC